MRGKHQHENRTFFRGFVKNAEECEVFWIGRQLDHQRIYVLFQDACFTRPYQEYRRGKGEV